MRLICDRSLWISCMACEIAQVVSKRESGGAVDSKQSAPLS